jgi:hypothetical protein
MGIRRFLLFSRRCAILVAELGLVAERGAL